MCYPWICRRTGLRVIHGVSAGLCVPNGRTRLVNLHIQMLLRRLRRRVISLCTMWAWAWIRYGCRRIVLIAILMCIYMLPGLGYYRDTYGVSKTEVSKPEPTAKVPDVKMRQSLASATLLVNVANVDESKSSFDFRESSVCMPKPTRTTDEWSLFVLVSWREWDQMCWTCR